VAAVALSALAACGKQAPPPEEAASAPAPPADQEAPVALNADAPIQYPPKLFDRRVEGDVVLRLFIDSTGHLVPESSRVGESSGYPTLDSAALAGAKQLRYAPARRRGFPVAAAFLQRIEFRHPQGDVLQGSPDASAR
jgi:protein TonB